MTIQGVILDIDGTLVLSNDAHAQAWVEAFAEFGYDVSFEQVRPLIGMGGDHLIPEVVPGLIKDSPDGKGMSQRRKELILQKFGPTLKPTNGARALLEHMKQQGLRLVVASSATKEELSLLLGTAQVEHLIDEATTTDDAKASKPSPDIVDVAFKKLNLKPEEVVMIGDTPYDVQAAQQCGIGVIAVRCGGFDDQSLSEAIALYDDPGDLLAHYDESPLGEATQKAA